ncbi:hypothetical protein V496_10291, partial [Pseudogymnoascus sp. VKM F-4515 (FW-2607)]
MPKRTIISSVCSQGTRTRTWAPVMDGRCGAPSTLQHRSRHYFAAPSVVNPHQVIQTQHSTPEYNAPAQPITAPSDLAAHSVGNPHNTPQHLRGQQGASPQICGVLASRRHASPAAAAIGLVSEGGN